MFFRAPVIISQLISLPPFPLPSNTHPRSRIHSRPSFVTTFKNKTTVLSLKVKAWKKISVLNSYPQPTATPSKPSEWLVTLPMHLWCPSCFPLLWSVPTPQTLFFSPTRWIPLCPPGSQPQCHPDTPAIFESLHILLTPFLGSHLIWRCPSFFCTLNCPHCTSLNEGTLLLSFSLPSSILYGGGNTVDPRWILIRLFNRLIFCMDQQGLRLLALKFLLSCTCTAIPTPVYHWDRPCAALCLRYCSGPHLSPQPQSPPATTPRLWLKKCFLNIYLSPEKTVVLISKGRENLDKVT